MALGNYLLYRKEMITLSRWHEWIYVKCFKLCQHVKCYIKFNMALFFLQVRSSFYKTKEVGKENRKLIYFLLLTVFDKVMIETGLLKEAYWSNMGPNSQKNEGNYSPNFLYKRTKWSCVIDLKILIKCVYKLYIEDMYNVWKLFTFIIDSKH